MAGPSYTHWTVVHPLAGIVGGLHGVDVAGLQLQILGSGGLDPGRPIEEGVADAVAKGLLQSQPGGERAVRMPDRPEVGRDTRALALDSCTDSNGQQPTWTMTRTSWR